MSLFKKPKKNLRQRTNVGDEEEETERQQAPEIETIPKSDSGNKLSDKPTKQATGELKKKSSVLSFHEDLEEDEGLEAFQVRKSSQSRRIAKRMERDRKLKEQGKVVGGKAKDSTDDAKPAEVSQIKEPSPPRSPKPLILSGRDAEMAGYRSESEEEESEEEGLTIKFRQPDSFRNVMESGVIPDAAMIHAARKQRQQARELGGMADYIKIDDANYPSKDSQAASAMSARLVREDEHDKSDEEENEDGRVDFTVDLQKKDKQQRREAFMAAEHSDERDETSEEDDWERQQFQKALSVRQIENTYTDVSLQSSRIEERVKRPPSREQFPNLPARPVRDPNATPDLTKLAPLPNPKDVSQKLRERLAGLEASHRRHANDLDTIETKLNECKMEVKELQEARPKLSEKFDFFQVMRGYVHDLIDCLSNKYVDVEALEKRWFALLAKRNKYLLERRREDVRDEASDCAIQSVIVQTINPDKLARTAEREARRRRRRNSRKDSSKHKDGLSSDDEPNEKDAKSFSIDEGKILEENKRLFEDVVEDFCSLDVIVDRLEDWRKQYRDSYRDAYVEMFVPRLAGCLVRHSLLMTPWNPLQHELAMLNNSKWFQTLTAYDMRSLNEESNERKDQAPLVISKTIELVILPYVIEIVKVAYDPCSTSQTNRLVKLVKTLSDEHPHLAGNNKAMQSLVAAASEKFEGSVDQDVFIPFHFVNQNPGFVSRQFWFAAKLLRNILHWHTLVDETHLRNVAIDKLLKRCMMLPLTKMTARGSASDPDTLDKIRWIAEALPKSWLGPMAPGAAQLQQLIETTMSLAQNADSTTTAGRKYVKDVAGALQKLGAAAEAQEILAKYL